MTRPDYTKHYRELEGNLTELLRLTSGHIGSSDVELVEHYLEHREYGLALETLASSLVASGATLSPSTLALVGRVATSMGGEEQFVADVAVLANSGR